MLKLELDFQKNPEASTWPGWLLLIAGILLCADTSVSYIKTSADTKKMEQVAYNNPSAANGPFNRTQARFTEEEGVKAFEIVDSISFPWGEVFSTLESVQTNGIGILEFSPTPGNNIIILRGEAASFPALLTYIAGLEQTDGFYDVYLEKHEIKHGEPQSSIAFALSAHWRRQ